MKHIQNKSELMNTDSREATEGFYGERKSTECPWALALVIWLANHTSSHSFSNLYPNEELSMCKRQYTSHMARASAQAHPVDPFSPLNLSIASQASVFMSAYLFEIYFIRS